MWLFRRESPHGMGGTVLKEEYHFSGVGCTVVNQQ